MIRSVYPYGIPERNIVATILKATVSALAYFHSNSQVHRDIKCENILVDFDGTIRVYDFGLVASLTTAKSKAKTLTGTPCWMAPEVFESERYDYAADIWSLSITALELAFGKPPYATTQQPIKIMMMVMENDPPTVDT